MSAPRHPDAVLMALGTTLDAQCATLAPLRDQANGPKASRKDDAAYQAADNKAGATRRAILAEPATTVEGVMVKLRALVSLYPEGLTAETIDFADGPSTDQRLARSILFDLMKIGGVA